MTTMDFTERAAAVAARVVYAPEYERTGIEEEALRQVSCAAECAGYAEGVEHERRRRRAPGTICECGMSVRV